MKRAQNITGSEDFSKSFGSMSEDDPFKIEIRNAMKILKENCTAGEKIEHDRWPDCYVKKYQINNLWRYELLDGKRFIYTILGSANGFTVSIIEAFANHTSYDNRFDY